MAFKRRGSSSAIGTVLSPLSISSVMSLFLDRCLVGREKERKSGALPRVSFDGDDISGAFNDTVHRCLIEYCIKSPEKRLLV
jgi:hypothetical protein